LKTLVITAQENTIILNKTTLQPMLTCLQVTEAKVRLLQYQSQLLNDELIDLKNEHLVKCYELVFVQHNPLYDDDDDYDFDKKIVKENLIKPTSEETSNEDESQAEDAKEQSDTTSISISKCETCQQI
jgi:hypothetical protein